jgi:excisionase family DNA binding protein
MNALARNNTTAGKVETADKYFLRPDEAAQFLGVSKRTLSNFQRRKLLSYSKLGRVVVFRKQDLLAAVERFRIHANGEV